MEAALKRKAAEAPADGPDPPLKAPRMDAAPPPPAANERVACLHDVSYPEGYDASASGPRVVAGGGEVLLSPRAWGTAQAGSLGPGRGARCRARRCSGAPAWASDGGVAAA